MANKDDYDYLKTNDVSGQDSELGTLRKMLQTLGGGSLSSTILAKLQEIADNTDTLEVSVDTLELQTDTLEANIGDRTTPESGSVNARLSLANTTLSSIDSSMGNLGATRAIRVDDTGTYTYVGLADPGTAEGASSWRVSRVENATGDTVFADGDGNFDNDWTNHASHSYS